MPDDSRSGVDAGAAYWIAAARARESERDDRLFDDPYAARLAGTAGPAALAASERASSGENAFLPVRTRFFDDLVRTEAERLDQVVLLGAGLDTRAFRLKLPASLRWFEIDTPELFAEKEPILAELGAVACCERTVVAADFAADWSTALLDAGFELGRRTGCLAEGLLFYLPTEAGRHLLSETRRLAGTGSLMAADMFGSGLLSLPSMQSYLASRAERGLPPPFTTDDPLATLRSAGWPSVELALPGQLGRTCGRPIGQASQRPIAHDPTMQSYLVVARSEG
jgi:methyltransferase (TIGR00027 family)